MRTLDVIEISTGKVVHSVDVTGKSERDIDKVEMGLLRNMDLDNFDTVRPATSTADGEGANG